MPWIHLDDVVGAILFALDTPTSSGPVNVTAPDPVTNKEFSRALGRVLHRPALAPVPALAVKAALRRDGVHRDNRPAGGPGTSDSSSGYVFRRPDLEAALRDATS